MKPVHVVFNYKKCIGKILERGDGYITGTSKGRCSNYDEILQNLATEINNGNVTTKGKAILRLQELMIGGVSRNGHPDVD